jgi:hypothetical protein
MRLDIADLRESGRCVSFAPMLFPFVTFSIVKDIGKSGIRPV